MKMPFEKRNGQLYISVTSEDRDFFVSYFCASIVKGNALSIIKSYRSREVLRFLLHFSKSFGLFFYTSLNIFKQI